MLLRSISEEAVELHEEPPWSQKTRRKKVLWVPRATAQIKPAEPAGRTENLWLGQTKNSGLAGETEILAGSSVSNAWSIHLCVTGAQKAVQQTVSELKFLSWEINETIEENSFKMWANYLDSNRD